MLDIPSHDVANIDEGHVFEVFQLQRAGATPRHGGNLRAPDNELAVHYAREFYGRRQESQALWIIPRAALWEIADTSTPIPHLQALTAEASQIDDTAQTIAIFGQKQAGQPLLWLRDVENMSLHTVTQAIWQGSLDEYKHECRRLWLCPRRTIIELADKDLLQPALDRSYRRLDGYNIREKLRLARQRVHTQGE